MGSNKAIDLFSGAGGLSLGLHMAGWDVIHGFEIDPAAIDTYKANFPESSMFSGDVRNVDFAKFKGIDLVAGGPPCQPFSVAGKQLADQDERDMVPEFIRAVSQIKPKAFLMENVAGLMTSRHKNYTDNIIKSFKKLGYIVSVKILCAYDFGVPQRRNRVFFVGTQKEGFVFPAPSHGPNRPHPYVTARAALVDVPKDAPNNAKVTYATKPIMRPSPFAGMLVNGQGRPIDLDGPCHTIPATAGGNRTHIVDMDGVLLAYHKELLEGGPLRYGQVEGVRRLTVAESARLQSFPDNFKFVGKGASRYRLVGNAVPPKLAYAVGREILKFLRNLDTKTKKETKPSKNINRSIILDASKLKEAEQYLMQVDPVLERVIQSHSPCGLCTERGEPFEQLCVSIMGQQLSVKAAHTIRARILNCVVALTPENVLNTNEDSLRACGLSRAKIKYIKTLSEFVRDGHLQFDSFSNLSADEAIDILVKVPGIGRWTAEMFLIFNLKYSDVLALDDAGLQRAARKLYGEKYDLGKLGKTWSPYCSVASWYLWQYIDACIMGE